MSGDPALAVGGSVRTQQVGAKGGVPGEFLLLWVGWSWMRVWRHLAGGPEVNSKVSADGVAHTH